MNIVIDANLTLALFIHLPYSGAAENAFRLWQQRGDRLAAPGLWQVEIVSALRKATCAGQLTTDDALLILAGLDDLQVEIHHPDRHLLEQSFLWSERIGQKVAYDSQYIALAESLQAELWSADRRLVSALKSRGIHWAHCLH